MYNLLQFNLANKCVTFEPFSKYLLFNTSITLLNKLREETFIEGIYFKKVDNLGRLLGKIVLSGGEIILKHDIVNSNILKQNTVVIAIIKKNNNLYVYNKNISFKRYT